MSKHPFLIEFLKFQESSAFHKANGNVGEILSPRNARTRQYPYRYKDSCYDAFTYFTTNGTGNPKIDKPEEGCSFKTYSKFKDLYPDKSYDSSDFHAFNKSISIAISNNDTEVLGSKNPEVFNSYEMINNYPFGHIAEDGICIYQALIKENDNWRAERNGRLIYLVNEKEDKLMFFTDLYWGQILDLAFHHGINNAGITNSMEQVAWLDLSSIIEMGHESFCQLGNEIDNVRDRVKSKENEVNSHLEMDY